MSQTASDHHGLNSAQLPSTSLSSSSSSSTPQQPCIQCYESNPSNALYCSWCGNKLSTNNHSSMNNVTTNGEQQQQREYVHRDTAEWQTLGILGGGQLGRMLCEAANRMNIHTIVLDPTTPQCPASFVGAKQIVGKFTDSTLIRELIKQCDVITAEIEHIDTTAIPSSASCQPTPSTIALIQDKYLQKLHLQRYHCQIGEFMQIQSTSDIERCIDIYGLPVMLKSRLHAYDGRGNAVIRTRDDITTALHSLTNSTQEDGNYMLYAEKWVTYRAELAVMVVRSITGEIRSYPAVHTIQHDNICHAVITPQQFGADIGMKAQHIAEQAISTLEGAGIYGVEIFLLNDENHTMLLNEIAPRPHNSGHHTIEACHTSQFENHIRAVMGLPLGDCTMKVPVACMINVLGTGDEVTSWLPCEAAMRIEGGGSIHWYSKYGSKLKRKIGHITFTAEDVYTLNRSITSWRQELDRMGKPLNVSSSNYYFIDDNSNPLDVSNAFPEVGIIMGSTSDHATMKAAADILTEFHIPYEMQVCSAHRTPEWMMKYATSAASRGLKVIIAGAGGAAHLPGMVAAMTSLPVIGVPVPLKVLDGMDSLLSIVQMPRGVPVATVAIGNSTNAGLLAARLLSSSNKRLSKQLSEYATMQSTMVYQQIETIKREGWQSITGK